jgi:hypothetical protein
MPLRRVDSPFMRSQPKQSAASKGKKKSDEAKANMRVAWERRRAEGKVRRSLSPEHRAKNSAAGKGRTPSPETRAKIAQAATGRKASEETRRILREAWVRPRESSTRVHSNNEPFQLPLFTNDFEETDV